MIFSTDILINSSGKSIEKSGLDIRLESESVSFFVKALQFIQEDSKVLLSQTMQSNITSIQEGTIGNFLISAIKKIDPVKILKKIIDYFLGLLNKLWTEFKILIISTFSKDKIITHYKKDLLNIDYPIDYQKERYIYSNLRKDMNHIMYKYKIEGELSDLILVLTDLKSISTKEGLIKKIEEIKQDIQNSNQFYDEIRGLTVEKQNPISKDQFYTELFNYYRSGGSLVKGMQINPNELKQIVLDYFDYKKILKEIENSKSSMEKTGKTIKAKLSGLNLEDYVKDTYTQEANQIFINIIKNKCDRVKNLCDIFLMSFTTRLDAAKEYQLQNREILYEAWKQMMKKAAKEG